MINSGGSKKKYVLYIFLYILSVFLMTSFLLVSMVIRYYMKSDTILQAVESVILNGMGISLPSSLNLLIKLLNKLLSFVISKGNTGIFLKIMSSAWIQPVLMLLMIGILIWMMKMHIQEGRKPGRAFQIFGITAFFPSTVILSAGLTISKAIALLHLPDKLETALQGKTVFFSGISILICILLICFGTIWNKKTAE